MKRQLYWSVKRELWENRFLYLAPMFVAAIVLFASLINVLYRASRNESVLGPFDMAPAPIMLATFIVGAFYSLDALYGERRDRSILFWKSLPVSDVTVVMSKASIPFVVLPATAYVISVAVILVMLIVSAPVVLGNGMSLAAMWRDLAWHEDLIVMFYGLAVHTLWFAPIYGWLILISAWAKRAPFLWAVLPPVAIAAFERIVFNTTGFASILGYRVIGAMQRAFMNDGETMTPLKFLSTPGLWIGLIAAAACLAAAVRLRRHREPI